MEINDTMLHYIEQSLDERLAETYPSTDPDTEFKQRIKRVTLNSICKCQDSTLLLRALELACTDLEAEKAHTITPSAADLQAKKTRLLGWNAEQKAKRAKEQEK